MHPIIIHFLFVSPSVVSRSMQPNFRFFSNNTLLNTFANILSVIIVLRSINISHIFPPIYSPTHLGNCNVAAPLLLARLQVLVRQEDNCTAASWRTHALPRCLQNICWLVASGETILQCSLFKLEVKQYFCTFWQWSSAKYYIFWIYVINYYSGKVIKEVMICTQIHNFSHGILWFIVKFC